MDVALAVDIGGTKLAAALVTEGGHVLLRRTVPTPTGTGAEGLWDRLAALVGEVLAADGADVVAAGRSDRDGPASGRRPVVCGVGCGGPMTPGGEQVSPLNIHAWRGFPLRSRLASLTGLPTAVDNDAKALALGEGWRGAARGERNFLAMVVSTGVGGGIVLDGRLLDGDGGNAGHVGHVIVEPDGRVCGCGARGCLEAEASGTAIAAATGRPPAEAGDEVRRRTGTNLLDLPLAVVAGSVALGYGDAFFAAAQAEIDARCRIEFARGTRIVAGGLGDAGPLVGAAAVGWLSVDRLAP
jgi:glucokinase